MGNYNTQYQSYYSNMMGKKKNYSGYGYNGGGAPQKSSIVNGNFLIRRFTLELLGTLVLFTGVIACRLVVTPETMKAYSYSKETINYNYDYKNIYKTLQSVDISKINITNVQNDIIQQIEMIKTKITGQKTVKETITSNYVMPVQGNIISYFGEIVDPQTKEKKFNNGVDIEAKENTEVKAAFSGTVKETGEDINLGKYIIINHGDGIETKYAHLNEIRVKNNDIINRGSIIGKSGITGKSKVPNLHFEVLYMGENKNPADYFPNEIK